MSEWDDWKAKFIKSNSCLYAKQEGHHRVACLSEATTKSRDDLPACARHARYKLRNRWIGYVRGAEES